MGRGNNYRQVSCEFISGVKSLIFHDASFDFFHVIVSNFFLASSYYRDLTAWIEACQRTKSLNDRKSMK